MTKISVIIPVYNAEKTLRACVESVLKQEYDDFELILVDDGSKDSSLKICEEYALTDSRVKVLHKENGGVSSTRNCGIAVAVGEWVTFVDADDYIEPSYFSEIPMLQADIVIGSYNHVKADRVYTEFCNIPYRDVSFKKVIQSLLNTSMLRAPWAKFYRRSIISDIRFPEDMKIGEDTCFVWQYLSRCQSFAVAEKSMYNVRLAVEEDHVKYAVSVDYAVNSLTHLYNAFEGLNTIHGIGKDKFFPFIGYFKNISEKDWRDNPTKWYKNPVIKMLYQYVWSDLALIQKVRLVIAQLFKR